MPDHNSNRTLLMRNTVAMYVRTAIVLVVSLYVTRALLSVLGETDYGIYNVVGSVVIFFTFLNTSITQAIQRFLTFELGRGDSGSLKKVFRSSLFIQFAVVLLLVVLCETLGVWFLGRKLNIPAERMDTAMWVFQFSIISFALGIVRSPFEAAVIAHERLSFFAYASIADSLIRLGIVFALNRCGARADLLFVYGALVATEALLMLILYSMFCRIEFEETSFRPQYDRGCMRQMLPYFGWNLLSNATNVATQQGFNFFLNIFYGVVVNAAMGIANQVISAVTAFVAGFQTSFRPQIVKAYSQNDLSEVGRLVNSTSRISFLLIFIPAIAVIVNAPLILGIWLEEVPDYTVAFCRMILVCCIIDGISGPFNCAIMSCSKIRNYQIAISLVFLSDLLISYLLFTLKIQPGYILYSRILTRGVINFIVGLHYMKLQLNFSPSGYLRSVLLPIIVYTALMTFPVLLCIRFFNGWSLFAVSCTLIIVAGIPLACLTILSREERMTVQSFISRRLCFSKTH